jgi:hypothetical protein
MGHMSTRRLARLLRGLTPPLRLEEAPGARATPLDLPKPERPPNAPGWAWQRTVERWRRARYAETAGLFWVDAVGRRRRHGSSMGLADRERIVAKANQLSPAVRRALAAADLAADLRARTRNAEVGRGYLAGCTVTGFSWHAWRGELPADDPRALREPFGAAWIRLLRHGTETARHWHRLADRATRLALAGEAAWRALPFARDALASPADLPVRVPWGADAPAPSGRSRALDVVGVTVYNARDLPIGHLETVGDGWAEVRVTPSLWVRCIGVIPHGAYMPERFAARAGDPNGWHAGDPAVFEPQFAALAAARSQPEASIRADWASLLRDVTRPDPVGARLTDFAHPRDFVSPSRRGTA